MGALRKGQLRQTDTYFRYGKERLKLRAVNGKQFELIYYKRPDGKNSKLSIYERCKISAGQAKLMGDILGKMYRGNTVVKKSRELWMYKNTRVHLDRVQKLGTFLELETVVSKKNNMDNARAEHYAAIHLLRLSSFPKVKWSYSDLLRS